MVKRAYQCGECHEVHEFSFQAERCCQPEVIDVYVCPLCDEAHEDESDAEKCCESVTPSGEQVDCPRCLRGHTEVRHAIEVEVAGHCSVCSPAYTVDENFRIEDRMQEHREEHAYLIR